MKLSLIILLCLVAGIAQAQTITTAVPFLRISPDARSGGMGDVGLATSADGASIFYNAAKTPFATSASGLVADYTPWLRNIAPDMYLTSLSGYHQIDDRQAIQAGIRYFNLGAVQFKDNNGQYIGSYKPAEFGIDISYSRKLSEVAALAVGFKYINSSLIGNSAVPDSKTGQAVAADISYYYHQSNGWSFGAAATNLGTKVSYSKSGGQSYFIPANLGIGANYEYAINDLNKVNFSLDLNKLLVPSAPVMGDSTTYANYQNQSAVGSWFTSFNSGLSSVNVSVGAEYWYDSIVALRAGYYYEDQSRGDRRFLTTGMGIRYKTIVFNFSYLIPAGSGINASPLSNTLRFGLTFDIEK